MRYLAPLENVPLSAPLPKSKPLAGEPGEFQSKAAQDDGILTASMSGSGVPVVQLQTETVTDVVAARMAISLLGHVLFLKNQIPLPVPQLTRIPSKNSTSKGAKYRAELLSSFDTLTSHLTTTFAALSIALAKTYSGSEKLEHLTAESGHHLDRAYLAVVLGPSPGSAKSRTFLAVDRFEAKLWGFKPGAGGENETREADEEARDGTDEESDCSSDTDEEGEEDDDDACEDEDEDSDAEGPEDSDLEGDGEDDDEDGVETDTSSSEPSEPPVPISFPLRDSTPITKPRTSMSPPPSISYAEEQRFLQNSERLLSRVLATADAEGYGFASELAPTQTHILLRAPRRFVHPAWVPRQNLTSSLESSLQDFIRYSTTAKSTAPPLSENRGTRKPAQKQRPPEGVWVTAARSSSSEVPSMGEPPLNLEGKDEDEMIWWSWDGGKFVGFQEW